MGRAMALQARQAQMPVRVPGCSPDVVARVFQQCTCVGRRARPAMRVCMQRMHTMLGVNPMPPSVAAEAKAGASVKACMWCILVRLYEGTAAQEMLQGVRAGGGAGSSAGTLLVVGSF